jgi:polyisoprenoid-binding protein YceI
MRSSPAFLAVLSLVASAGASAAHYEIDPAHSSATFSVRHLMVANVRGEFGTLSGTVDLDDKDVTKSKVDAKVDASSINTRNAKRDGHLKSPDFFDVAKYPELTFKSTKVEKNGPGKLKVTGDLFIHGITKSVVFDTEYTEKDVKDAMGKPARGAVAVTKINRKDFGLLWNKPIEGGQLVGDEVTITLDLELNKAEPKTITGSR